MTFLPLIERELRLRARSPAAYWTRFVVGLTGVLICLPQLTSSLPFGTPASVGGGVFNALVSAAFLLICGVCVLTADALNTDQREGTLGLLLLTRVRVVDVLLGKLGSIGLTSVCVMLAFLPMLMLPVLSGGVSGGEVFRKELGLVNVLLFALAAGLYASASKRERFKAARFALILVGAVALGPFLLDVVFGHRGLSARPLLASLPSPLVLLISAGDAAYKASAGSYWISMAILSALSCLLLAGACVRLRRALREGSDTAAPPKGAASGTKAEVAQPRRRHRFAGEASPIAWRVGGQRGLRATVWAAALLGFLYYGLFRFLASFWGMRSVAFASWSFALAATAVIGSLCAWAASRFFVESRRTGELELLLTTPVGAQTLVTDQWKVLKRVIRWPLVLMLVPEVLIGIYIILSPRFGPMGSWRIHYAISVPLYVLNTVLGLAALCWLALWFGLRAGGQARAILWSVAIAKALPYVVSVLFSILGPLLFTPHPAPSSAAYWTIWLVPQGLNIAYSLWLIRLARRRLQGDLTATGPLQLDLRQEFSSKARGAVSAFRLARHWTPS
jgi:hypothetical protein